MGIKRENWKGKYKLVARDIKGKILSYKKFSPRTATADKRRFKINNSFLKSTKVRILTNVKEVTKSSSIEPKKKFMAEVTYTFFFRGKKRKISARSNNDKFSKNTKFKDADESALERVSQFFYGEDTYDSSLGKQRLQKIKFRRQRRVVFYEPIKKNKATV